MELVVNSTYTHNQGRFCMKNKVLHIILLTFAAFIIGSSAVDIGYFLSFPDIFYKLAQIFALAAFCALMYQFIVSSKFKFMDKTFGKGTLIKAHQKYGIAALALAVAHVVSLFTYEMIYQIEFYPDPYRLLGVIGLILLVITGGLAIFRKSMDYKIWKKTHLLMYPVFPLVLLHSYFLGSDVISKFYLQIIWWIFGGIFLIIVIRNIVFYVTKNRGKS